MFVPRSSFVNKSALGQFGPGLSGLDKIALIVQSVRVWNNLHRT